MRTYGERRKGVRTTLLFAEIKAIMYMALMKQESPVIHTEDAWGGARVIGLDTDTHITYVMALEALEVLQYQGMVQRIGSVDYGYFWWSKERLV